MSYSLKIQQLKQGWRAQVQFVDAKGKVEFTSGAVFDTRPEAVRWLLEYMQMQLRLVEA